MKKVPDYLKNYEELWKRDPHEANLEWFKNAKWGLFMHYGLYSQLGKKSGEWVMYRNDPPIPIAEYEKLMASFRPDKFDADFITDLALEAEMSYVNLTTCHHEGFCLWKSDTEAYNSYNACKRDLMRELAEQCDKKGLGFFAYYTHILNWRHPYAIPRELLEFGRPEYDFDEPRYIAKEAGDITEYWKYAHACMKELLELEFPLAGLWLDLIYAYYAYPDLIRIEDTYELIRKVRPETLISFKQGATGTEDFASPEFSFRSMAARMKEENFPAGAELAEKAWERNRLKHNEICMTLQREGWGYVKDAVHYDVDEVWERLAYALKNNCNMLTNTGPLPDGSIHPGDISVLREMGKRIRERGWPRPEDAIDLELLTKPPKNENTGAAAG